MMPTGENAEGELNDTRVPKGQLLETYRRCGLAVYELDNGSPIEIDRRWSEEQVKSFLGRLFPKVFHWLELCAPPHEDDERTRMYSLLSHEGTKVFKVESAIHGRTSIGRKAAPERMATRIPIPEGVYTNWDKSLQDAANNIFPPSPTKSVASTDYSDSDKSKDEGDIPPVLLPTSKDVQCGVRAYIEISDDDEPSVPGDVNLDGGDVQADESVRDMADWVDPADGAGELNTLQVPHGVNRSVLEATLSYPSTTHGENDAPAPKRVKRPSSWASRSSNRVSGQRKLAVASSSVKKGFAASCDASLQAMLIEESTRRAQISAVQQRLLSAQHNTASTSSTAHSIISAQRIELSQCSAITYPSAAQFKISAQRGSAGLNVQTDRYTQSDLDRAVGLETEALQLRPPGHPRCDTILANLAVSLKHQCERTGAQSDLDRAVGLETEALQLRPPGHPLRDTILANLAVSLKHQCERTGAQSDLDRAVRLETEALQLRPPGHPLRDTILANLAASLMSQYERTGAQSDLDRAVGLETEALQLRPPGHPLRDTILANLAVSLKHQCIVVRL
ncbi:hypothetical protein HGRIS_011280 [Hohenbuehelia grisea]|uniref:Uncharacterized protein n=1 Tax=Hohenbuehelia grisea TaxID=104357 RepID=A0ABR3JUK4_9AGAR